LAPDHISPSRITTYTVYTSKPNVFSLITSNGSPSNNVAATLILTLISKNSQRNTHIKQLDCLKLTLNVPVIGVSNM